MLIASGKLLYARILICVSWTSRIRTNITLRRLHINLIFVSSKKGKLIIHCRQSAIAERIKSPPDTCHLPVFTFQQQCLQLNGKEDGLPCFTNIFKWMCVNFRIYQRLCSLRRLRCFIYDFSADKITFGFMLLGKEYVNSVKNIVQIHFCHFRLDSLLLLPFSQIFEFTFEKLDASLIDFAFNEHYSPTHSCAIIHFEKDGREDRYKHWYSSCL